MTRSPFSERVRVAFGRRVAAYEPLAPLQRAMAWRLAGVAAHHGARPSVASRTSGLPEGPCADLGAGTGLVGRALREWGVALPAPLRQLDLCPEALARNSSGPSLPWDLNEGLPPQLRGAALLASSFALQWLADPTAVLAHWADHLAPGGWLLLSVPTAGSFPEWRQAALRTGLPCSALPLPAADALLAAALGAGLEPLQVGRLTFSRGAEGSRSRPGEGAGGWSAPAPGARSDALGQADPSGVGIPTAPAAVPARRGPATVPHPALRALRALRAIGADATPHGTSLSPGDWRRLLAAWPEGGGLSWEVLLLLARQPPAPFLAPRRVSPPLSAPRRSPPDPSPDPPPCAL
ncbi:MAG: methyltransferase domain-containing protein [Cyanobacteriota bacterium]|nr:methyltransferase domain-containing protein [Cyanobacteriota bacterium]